MRKTALLLVLAASAAGAQGLDRDTLLTDAPAVPQQGTVRVTGGLAATSDKSGIGNTQGQAQLTGNIQWTPLQNLAGDVGAYYQPSPPDRQSRGWSRAPSSCRRWSAWRSRRRPTSPRRSAPCSPASISRLACSSSGMSESAPACSGRFARGCRGAGWCWDAFCPT